MAPFSTRRFFSGVDKVVDEFADPLAAVEIRNAPIVLPAVPVVVPAVRETVFETSPAVCAVVFTTPPTVLATPPSKPPLPEPEVRAVALDEPDTSAIARSPARVLAAAFVIETIVALSGIDSCLPC